MSSPSVKSLALKNEISARPRFRTSLIPVASFIVHRINRKGFDLTYISSLKTYLDPFCALSTSQFLKLFFSENETKYDTFQEFFSNALSTHISLNSLPKNLMTFSIPKVISLLIFEMYDISSKRNYLNSKIRGAE